MFFKSKMTKTDIPTITKSFYSNKRRKHRVSIFPISASSYSMRRPLVASAGSYNTWHEYSIIESAASVFRVSVVNVAGEHPVCSVTRGGFIIEIMCRSSATCSLTVRGFKVNIIVDLRAADSRTKPLCIWLTSVMTLGCKLSLSNQTPTHLHVKVNMCRQGCSYLNNSLVWSCLTGEAPYLGFLVPLDWCLMIYQLHMLYAHCCFENDINYIRLSE